MRALLALHMAVLVAAAATGGPPAAAGPGQITVLVDGTVLTLDVPPVQIEGRVLVPLRGIFERLGARVAFDPAAQTVTATRESITVILRLGSREARLNDRIVLLDVPPLALRGRTMVPLRFVSEALGARVDWDERARTVQIYTTAPLASPPPAAQTIEGTLLRVDAEQGRIHMLTGSLLHVLVVTAETSILRRETTTGTGGSVNIRELRPGDQVVAVVNARLEAATIRATYRQVRGIVNLITLRTITLQDGSSFTLHLDLIVSGRVKAREEIRPGMSVGLRLNPLTNIVWEVTVE
jgi:hypothetical protein